MAKKTPAATKTAKTKIEAPAKAPAPAKRLTPLQAYAKGDNSVRDYRWPAEPARFHGDHPAVCVVCGKRRWLFDTELEAPLCGEDVKRVRSGEIAIPKPEAPKTAKAPAPAKAPKRAKAKKTA